MTVSDILSITFNGTSLNEGRDSGGCVGSDGIILIPLPSHLLSNRSIFSNGVDLLVTGTIKRTGGRRARDIDRIYKTS